MGRELNLNIIPGRVASRLHLNQYDKDILLTFHVYDGDVPFDMSGMSVSLEGIKPDEKAFSYPASVSGNTVTISVVQNVTAVHGEVMCELRVRSESRDIGTQNFIIDVEESPIQNNADLSETEIATLVKAQSEAAASVVQAKNQADAAAASAAQAAASAVQAKNYADAAAAATAHDTKVYMARGTIFDSVGGSAKGAGVAIVVCDYKTRIATIHFEVTIIANGTTGTQSIGLNRDLIKQRNPNIPTITPISNAAELNACGKAEILKADGILDKARNNYGGVLCGQGIYWIFESVQQASGPLVLQQETIYTAGVMVRGTAYGTF